PRACDCMRVHESCPPPALPEPTTLPVYLFGPPGARGNAPSFPTRRSSDLVRGVLRAQRQPRAGVAGAGRDLPDERLPAGRDGRTDRKSTRLNSSHVKISYAVFSMKKKTNVRTRIICMTGAPKYLPVISVQL